ncbi:hypothetical protein [Halorarum salinum]|uniref:Uncharacterized protein n=1 Tax=Halorarum salinum TaxID=2743089 RepID=A0A7D5L9T5_9EURY|nr:hypothetical protein [Halobaculum salinum]QLG61331.1 hypothetical protein HUG12_06115 [Halobaculum salinum]
MPETTDHGTFTHLEGELAWTIAEHRSPTDAVAMTERLLDRDDGPFELLGLVDGCERAVYWAHLTRTAVRAAFDADGVDRFEEPGDSDGPRRKGEYLQREAVTGWDWVHPRHRWCTAEGRRR